MPIHMNMYEYFINAIKYTHYQRCSFNLSKLRINKNNELKYKTHINIYFNMYEHSTMVLIFQTYI